MVAHGAEGDPVDDDHLIDIFLERLPLHAGAITVLALRELLQHGDEPLRSVLPVRARDVETCSEGQEVLSVIRIAKEVFRVEQRHTPILSGCQTNLWTCTLSRQGR